MRYKEQGGHATLVLMGAKLMPLPDVPWVRYAGLLSEADRLRALEAATIVVVPSPFESLSLLALEGMAVGHPVLCNAHADVLVDHCRRSNAGLFYSIARNSWSARICCSLTASCVSGWATTAKCTSPPTTLGRDHGEGRQTDGRAPQSDEPRPLLAKARLRCDFSRRRLVIYVMRSVDQRSISRAARDRRRTRLRRDRVQRVAGARIRLSLERRRVAKALSGNPQYRLLLTRQSEYYPTTYRPPGCRNLLTAVYAVAGRNFAAWRVVNCGVTAGAIITAAIISAQFAGIPAAVITAAIFCKAGS